MRQNKFADAEAHFARALSIYRVSYNDKHYVIGIVQSNLGGVFVERKDYLRAEQFFRDALQTYSQTLPSDHTSVAISRIRLGTALVGQSRFVEAQAESLAGYEILSKKTSPTIKWLQTARKDLASEYAGLHQPELAAKYLNAASR
jgi:tetratricopeptide (TPR) repeat protein